MATKVAINGFGRIGRAVTRVLLQRSGELDLVAINDLADARSLAHLFKYDTVMGKWPGTVEVNSDGLVIDGKAIKVLAVRNPAELPWSKMGVRIVVESTGIFRTKESPKGGYGDHLKAGASKVVLTVPAKDDIDATVVLGVNDDIITTETQCISNASCTTNCLAPLTKALNDAFGVEKGMMVTVHGYTNDQRVADMIHSDMRRARAAAMNIPVVDGSCVDLVADLKKEVTADEVNAAVKAAADGALKGILEYCDEPIVSSDILGNPASSIFDSLCTMTMGRTVKVVSWYDNEWGYSNRTVDIMEKIA